ncbi:hypothetical protein SDC49_04780 [Lactobacillus sp. R2/2]|nr:hypothetical protein [Lactobacillus sp. R2/2]
MHNTKEKAINHYTGTITFFFVALITCFNSGFSLIPLLAGSVPFCG